MQDLKNMSEPQHATGYVLLTQHINVLRCKPCRPSTKTLRMQPLEGAAATRLRPQRHGLSTPRHCYPTFFVLSYHAVVLAKDLTESAEILLCFDRGQLHSGSCTFYHPQCIGMHKGLCLQATVRTALRPAFRQRTAPQPSFWSAMFTRQAFVCRALPSWTRGSLSSLWPLNALQYT